MKLYQITEADLEVLEAQVPAIFDIVTSADCYNERPDIREGADMVKSIISNVRWNYGPPQQVKKVEAGGEV